jgi:predicted enzyme related to lactoylglutathione lyase
MSQPASPKVLGVGGVFFKSNDPEGLAAWYRDHLGIGFGDGCAMFPWRDGVEGDAPRYTVFSPFPADTEYFGGSPHPFMINLLVVNLDGLLERLRTAGVPIDPKGVEAHDYGRFAWITDPEGRRIELWEPAGKQP